MRLIDADKLKENFIGVYEDEINFAFDGYAIKCIDDAPSIDIDRPQGEWMATKYFDEWYGLTYTCNICGSETIGGCDNYCPNCGARMKGVNNEG